MGCQSRGQEAWPRQGGSVVPQSSSSGHLSLVQLNRRPRGCEPRVRFPGVQPPGPQSRTGKDKKWVWRSKGTWPHTLQNRGCHVSCPLFRSVITCHSSRNVLSSRSVGLTGAVQAARRGRCWVWPWVLWPHIHRGSRSSPSVQRSQAAGKPLASSQRQRSPERVAEPPALGGPAGKGTVTMRR